MTDGGGPRPVPLRFRPLDRSDFPLLGTWLAAPHVARWWAESGDPDALESRYGPTVDGTDPTEVFIASLDGLPVGLVQRYRFGDEAGWATALAPAGIPSDSFGIDYLVGDPDRTGQGLGPTMIRAFVDDSWDRYPGCGACVVAVHVDNRRSWRALERCGFQRDWIGRLDTDDPADDGPQAVYVFPRPAARPPD